MRRCADQPNCDSIGWNRRTGIGSDLRNCDRRRSPFVDCMPTAAIEALCCGVLRTTVRTDSSRFKRVERLSTLCAFPICSNWRSGVAGRTCVSCASWKFCHAQEGLGVFEPSPAIHCYEEGDRSQPKVLSPECNPDKTHRSEQPENGSSHQASSSANNKP